jgi:hypothetical protein
MNDAEMFAFLLAEYDRWNAPGVDTPMEFYEDACCELADFVATHRVQLASLVGASAQKVRP